MQWNSVGIAEAKELVRKMTNKYQQEYKRRVEDSREGDGRNATKLQTYLRALSYQIPGTIAWSLRCPRYHPERCDEASALLEAEMRSEEITNTSSYTPYHTSDSETSPSEKPTAWTADESFSKRSSVSSIGMASEETNDPKRESLGTEVS
jgi:hypothetical protein